MKSICTAILLLLISVFVTAQIEIKLYPQGAAESSDITQGETVNSGGTVRDITDARMYVYAASAENANGTAVLICPGGGYAGVSAQKEGKEIAQWFNERGITAFVLYYRMPNGHNEIPLKDAQTAMKIIRSRAKEWDLNKKAIGIMGFSAGGHLAATAGTHFTRKTRPDFMMLIYPVITMETGVTHQGSRDNLIGKNPTQKLVDYYSIEKQVEKKTPITFLIHATDDKAVPIENSQRMLNALKQYNVPAELHIYNKGGHGFGMRKLGHDVDNWPTELNNWLLKNRLIKK